MTRKRRTSKSKPKSIRSLPNHYVRKSSKSKSKWTWLTSYLTGWDDMPHHLQFNTYIRKGYRKVTDWKGCLLSLVIFHNESFNIMTHLPIAVYTILNWKVFWPWGSVIGQPYLCGLGIFHTTAVIVPWIPSVIYHLFMCHKNGPVFYNFLLKCDTTGIWITEFFGSLTNLAASIWKLPESVQGLLMGAFNVTSVIGLIKSFKANTPRERVMCFVPLFLARVMSILIRFTQMGGGDPTVLHHIILQDVTSILGGVIGIARIPEKWFTGYLDYFANSHNLMHLLVILAVWHMNQAANGDVRWIMSQLSPKRATVGGTTNSSLPIKI